MSTNSTISVLCADGSVASIYCHWDGYIAHNGELLRNYYNSQALAEELVSLGNMSSLNKKIYPMSESHSFDYPEPGVCVYYARDRGKRNVGFGTFDSLQDFMENGDHLEYNYIWVDDRWVCFYEK